ncbi:MAG: magnesium/cobalt transporter CorA [Pontiellaceae bacterium]|nr:magnesium/cobalt transporter CorA [Pontiellaceae bacterium]MBN2785143.1 magnesium/cobalt transporter CorA [Pontiellaceae bacterium]
MEGIPNLKRLFTVSAKSGQPPGTIVYSGHRTAEPTRISLFEYDTDQLSEKHDIQLEECAGCLQSEAVSWINVDGLNDASSVERIGELFNIHPLVLEDVLHTTQRPKLEDNGTYLFLVVRMLYIPEGSKEVQSEQLSFILTENALITFQECAGDVFESVRERIRNSHGRIRKMGVDYLLYALMDAIVDGYFLIMESTGEQIEAIEQSMMEDPSAVLLNQLYHMKRELLYLRKSVWPLREAIGALERGESALLTEKTSAYIRDLYDHTIQVIDTVETFRDMLSGVQDLYLSSMGQKTNQVMQVLTIIATIFIPLTFVAGIYGMNFDYIPELHWKYSYFAFWGVILLMTLGMVIYFRRQKWF